MPDLLFFVCLICFVFLCRCPSVVLVDLAEQLWWTYTSKTIPWSQVPCCAYPLEDCVVCSGCPQHGLLPVGFPCHTTRVTFSKKKPSLVAPSHPLSFALFSVWGFPFQEVKLLAGDRFGQPPLTQHGEFRVAPSLSEVAPQEMDSNFVDYVTFLRRFRGLVLEPRTRGTGTHSLSSRFRARVTFGGWTP